jgi:hypothetical protein
MLEAKVKFSLHTSWIVKESGGTAPNVLGTRKWVVHLAQTASPPGETDPRYPLNRRLGGAQQLN